MSSNGEKVSAWPILSSATKAFKTAPVCFCPMPFGGMLLTLCYVR